MRITTELLLKLNACKSQVTLFKELFPNGAEVNRENLAEAKDAKLDINWLFQAALSKPRLEAYENACKHHLEAYENARKPHRETYENALIDAQIDALAHIATPERVTAIVNPIE